MLPFAIQHRTHAAVGPRDDGVLMVTSTFDPEPVQVALSELDQMFPTTQGNPAVGWAAYPLGVAWALLQNTATPADQVTGLDVVIASDVPVGAGLSSSAAIESAVGSALNDVWQLGVDRVGLAQVGRKAENEAVNAPTGIMDQMASMLGQADAAVFLDCRSLQTETIELGFDAAGLEILVMDTRVSHSHATGGYGERRAACERAAAAVGVPALRDLSVDDLPRLQAALDEVTFRRARHVITENQRVLDTVAALRAGDLNALGDLLTGSHASMRDDFEISTVELDSAVEAALAAGALGARMTGGGFGGAAIALIARDRLDAATAAVAEAFATAGFKAPNQFTVTPSEGARRDT